MNKFLPVVILSAIPFMSQADEGDWNATLTYGKLQHEWTDHQGNPKFETDLYGVGLNYWITDKINFGVIYNEIKPTFEEGGFNPLLRLDFEHNYGYEVKYKLLDYPSLDLNVGYGRYWMPTNQTAFNKDGSVSYEIKDDDGDDGYFVEINTPLSEQSEIGVKFAIYSTIHSWDETTEALQVTYTYKF